MMKSLCSPLGLLLALSFAAPAVQAQPENASAHRVPFAAEGNTLALTVANAAEDQPTSALVAVAEAPVWLVVTPTEVSLDSLAAGAEAVAAFTFDIAHNAPVGEAGAVRFTITTADGQAWDKAVWLEVAAPDVFRLAGAYPNPFHTSATLAFEVPDAAHVRLSVFDLLGREVARLVDDRMEVGRHEVEWQARGLASGVYVCRLSAETKRGQRSAQHQRLTLIR